MQPLDSNFVAEEMELYDEIRSTLDEDELLIIMSRLQEHFLEKLSFQNEERLRRDTELNKPFIEESDTDFTETDFTTNYESLTDTEYAESGAGSPTISLKSFKSANSNKSLIKSATSPPDGEFAFDLPYATLKDRVAIGDRDKNGAWKSKSMKSLTTDNLKQHNANTTIAAPHPLPLPPRKAASFVKSNVSLGGSSSSRPITPNKYKFLTKSKRGFSMQDPPRNKLKLRQQASSNGSSPRFSDRQRSKTLPQSTIDAGTYRLDLFCDIKFVKKIFVRWISCKSDVLCHVASRTLGILFSHSYLTADQFLDLAELLLGVHEENNLVFGNVEVTYRATRPGIFYGDCSDSSSTPIDSDYDSEEEPEPEPEPEPSSSSSDSDLIESIRTHTNRKTNAPPLNLKSIDENDHHTPINENDKLFATRHKLGRRISIASSTSSRSSRVSALQYDVHWDNRLYCAMKVLSCIVNNKQVYEGCVVALDEWFSIIVIDLFRRSRRAGIGVLEGFLYLIKSILTRFACNKEEIMGQCKLSQVICSDANDELLDIITCRTSTLVTRASALELCPLLMITSQIGAKKFAHHCLICVLDDGRFNPFEPGDITMSRTFQRGENGQLKSINEKNPLEKSYTVANYLPSLLFQRQNDVFIDQEAVQRLTFLCVIKAMNVLSQQIIELEDDSVDKLEGEFDSTTARKIRNFFSRDAEYTRMRILDLVCEEDDVLIKMLLELLLIENALKKSNSRLAVRIRYLFDPFMLFYEFIDLFDADYIFLMDFLINGETVFLEYLLKFCKRLSANWNPNSATQTQINRVMSILIRLRMHIQDLYQKRQFPYSPKALLKVMEKVEFCYESDAVKKNTHKPNMFDLDYLNYVKKKNIQKQEKEEKAKKKKQEKKAKKPKKMMINSLFLQDIKQMEAMKKRKSEIIRKQEINLAKRKKKKAKKTSSTKKINFDDDNDNIPNTSTVFKINQSKAEQIINSKRKKYKYKTKSKTKHNIKDKVDVSSLKKIQFHEKVDADRKVRIGF